MSLHAKLQAIRDTLEYLQESKLLKSRMNNLEFRVTEVLPQTGPVENGKHSTTCLYRISDLN